MVLKEGHEDCETCAVCGLAECPDCDEDGRACDMAHFIAERRDPVDEPLYRRKPRKHRGG